MIDKVLKICDAASNVNISLVQFRYKTQGFISVTQSNIRVLGQINFIHLQWKNKPQNLQRWDIGLQKKSRMAKHSTAREDTYLLV